MASNNALSRQSDVTDSIPASTKLRRLLNESNRLIVCPGVYDGFSARIAIDVGFDALYMVSDPKPSGLPNLPSVFIARNLGCSLIPHI